MGGTASQQEDEHFEDCVEDSTSDSITDPRESMLHQLEEMKKREEQRKIDIRRMEETTKKLTESLIQQQVEHQKLVLMLQQQQHNEQEMQQKIREQENKQKSLQEQLCEQQEWQQRTEDELKRQVKATKIALESELTARMMEFKEELDQREQWRGEMEDRLVALRDQQASYQHCPDHYQYSSLTGLPSEVSTEQLTELLAAKQGTSMRQDSCSPSDPFSTTPPLAQHQCLALMTTMVGLMQSLVTEVATLSSDLSSQAKKLDYKNVEEKRVAYFEKGVPKFQRSTNPVVWLKRLESKREEHNIPWETVFFILEDFFSESDKRLQAWFQSRRPQFDRALTGKVSFLETWATFRRDLLIKFDQSRQFIDANTEFWAYKWDPTVSAEDFFIDMNRLIYTSHPNETESTKVQYVMTKIPDDIRNLLTCVEDLASLEKFVTEIIRISHDTD